MPPQRTKDRNPTLTPFTSFFAPCPCCEGLVLYNYNNIERNEIIPSNTLRPTVSLIILFPGPNPTANPLANKCDSSGGMSPVHVLLTCTRISLSKRDTLASASEAIKARPCTL
jgi:hypothetical protein